MGFVLCGGSARGRGPSRGEGEPDQGADPAAGAEAQIDAGELEVEIGGNAGNEMQTGSLGCRTQTAQLHVFDPALAKRCHAEAPWMLDWSFVETT